MSPNPQKPDPQRLAADPMLSAFVTANAGSGKTKTLIDRVARLLLAGAEPEAVLCVTYTKAAAAEMQGRLFERLGGWAIADDAELAKDLSGIGEAAHDLARARALFAGALETPGGLKIQTLHAFCEKLLRRFPLEAGLSPAFEIMDDLKGRALASGALRDLLTLDAPDALVEAYDEVFPLAEGWRERIALHQLYPLAAHACLFGGGYGSRVRATLARLI